MRWADTAQYAFALLLVIVACGAWIAVRRRRPWWEGALWGLFGPIGLIIVAILPSGWPAEVPTRAGSDDFSSGPAVSD